MILLDLNFTKLWGSWPECQFVLLCIWARLHCMECLSFSIEFVLPSKPACMLVYYPLIFLPGIRGQIVSFKGVCTHCSEVWTNGHCATVPHQIQLVWCMMRTKWNLSIIKKCQIDIAYQIQQTNATEQTEQWCYDNMWHIIRLHSCKNPSLDCLY